jgi:YVTN family beta-propeller protein
VVFNSSGRSAYVTSAVSEKRSGSIKLFVSKIDTATEKQVNMSSPFGVSGQGWTSIYGHTLYVTDDQDTVVLDTKTKKVVKTLPAEFPTGSAITPDGTYLYIPSEPYVVTMIDTTTYKVVDSILVGRGPSAVAIAPNGLRAYVTNSTDGTVSVIDISTQ